MKKESQPKMQEVQDVQNMLQRHEAELQQMLAKMKELQTVEAEKDYATQQFHDMMFNTFNIIEISSAGIITRVSRNAMQKILVGKPISEFINLDVFDAVWERLTAGQSYEYVQNIDTGIGHSILIRQKFMPMRNLKGQLMRVIMASISET